MILIISLRREEMYQLEFIKPIEDILKKGGRKFIVRHYEDVEDEEIGKSACAIIAGTYLKDDSYAKDVNRFSWIKSYRKPILGICAGMQIITLLHGGRLTDEQEIGVHDLEVVSEDDIIGNPAQAYMLHNHGVTVPKGFKVIARTGQPQIIRKGKSYGVLFHPEVMNKEIIERFTGI